MKKMITLLTVLIALTILVMPVQAKPPGETEPTREITCSKYPVQYSGGANSTTATGRSLSVIFTMPNDIEYMVIEQVTLASLVHYSQNVTDMAIQTTMGGVFATHHLTYQDLCYDCTIDTGMVPVANVNIFNVSQQTRIYADPGSTVHVKVLLDGPPTSPFNVNATISGYEVPAGCSE